MSSRSPDQRAVRTLLIAQAGNAVGDGCFLVVSALFFVHVVGLSVAGTGLRLSTAWGVGFLLTTPLGHLADRFGLRRSAVLGSLLVAAALAGATVVRGPGPVTAVITLYAIGQSGLTAIRQALVATLVRPAQRVAVRARVHVAVNGGLGVGAGVGGLALLGGSSAGYRAVLLLDAFTFLLAAAVLTRLPGRPAGPIEPAGPGRRLEVLRDRRYLAAAGLNAVLYLYMPTLSVALPLWIARRTAAPGWSIAVLFVLNTVGVLALQVRAARTVTSAATAVLALRRAGIALFGCCLVFWLVAAAGSGRTALLLLIVGALVQVTGEVLLAAGSWQVGFGLADPDRPGQWQGLYASGIPLARAIGPTLLTGLLVGWSGPGWLVLGVLFAAAGLLMGPVVRSGAAGRAALPVPAPG